MKTLTFDPALYVVVPREPTHEILAAAMAGITLPASWDVQKKVSSDYSRAYRAMIAAAAPPPAAEGQGDAWQWIDHITEPMKNAGGEAFLHSVEMMGKRTGLTGNDMAVGVFTAMMKAAVEAPPPAAVAAPATAQAEPDLIEELRNSLEKAVVKGSSSTRASVPDEPQPAVREDADLRECPFCGGEAVLTSFNSVACRNTHGCGVELVNDGPLDDEQAITIARWNRRTEKPR